MNTPERDLDKDAVTDAEIFAECKARLKLAEENESDNRLRAIEDLQFADGDQWPTDIANGRRLDGRPALTINHTNTFVRRVVNSMRQQRPRIKAHAVGDGARVEDAKVANGLIRHVETLSQASVAYDTGGESAVRIGWGYWRIVGEYLDERSDQQELKIKPIRNTFTVYIDPSAVMPDGSDANWYIITEKMKRTEYKARYPKADNAEWTEGAAGDADLDWESKEDVRLAEYFRIRKTWETLYPLSNGSGKFESELPGVDVMKAAGVDFKRDADGKPITRLSERRQVEWYRVNGTKVVDRVALPGQWIPVIRCEGNVLDLNGQVKRKGMIRDMVDAQRMLNYWYTCETEVVALAPRAKWVAAEGQIESHPEWIDANRSAYSVLTYKPVVVSTAQGDVLLPPPQRQAPEGVSEGIVRAAEGAEHNLMAIAGFPHEPGQDQQGQVISGLAIQRRQSISDITHFQYYDKQTLAIAHTGRILLDYFPYYYGEDRMQRIIGDDGVPQMTAINQALDAQGQPVSKSKQAIATIKNDLTVGRFDVVMDTGPGYETKRQEGAEALLGLLSTPLGEPITKVGADLVVRNMDFAGADDLADRLVPLNPEGMDKAVQELPKQGQAIVGALQQQLKQTQAELQHAQLELKYKTSTELGWMHVEREKAHLTAETKVHDTEVRAHTAHDVAEINAGAQLLNTHTEAAHDRVAAHELLKSAERAEHSASP